MARWILFLAPCLQLLLAPCDASYYSTLTTNPEAPLLLTDYIDDGRAAEGRKLSEIPVGSMPGIDQRSYAGFISGDRYLGNQLFFWFFESLKNPYTSPLLIWLNGGPADSSMQGVLWEHGPLGVESNADGTVRVFRRKLYWAQEFSIVYIDSPVGAGYSFTGTPEYGFRESSTDNAADLYEFLEQFYVLFPEYGSRPLYIGGYSYAGKYVSALGYLIDREIQSGRSRIPLTGIYLGSPFFEPETQIRAGSEMFFNFGVHSIKEKTQFDERLSLYTEKFKKGELTNASLIDLFLKLAAPKIFQEFGTDNIVNGEEVDETAIATFMTAKRVRDALHVGPDLNFTASNISVLDSFGGDYLESFSYELGTLMERYKVLIYSGDLDFVVQQRAVELAVLAIPWSGSKEYHAANTTIWKGTKEEGGKEEILGFYSKTEEFCRVTLKNAGHIAPRDQPEASLKMLVDFINDGCIVGPSDEE